MIRGEDAVVAGEVDAWLGHQGSQAGNEIDRLEGHLCRPVPVRCLQGVNHLAHGVGRRKKAWLRVRIPRTQRV